MADEAPKSDQPPKTDQPAGQSINPPPGSAPNIGTNYLNGLNSGVMGPGLAGAGLGLGMAGLGAFPGMIPPGGFNSSTTALGNVNGTNGQGTLDTSKALREKDDNDYKLKEKNTKLTMETKHKNEGYEALIDGSAGLALGAGVGAGIGHTRDKRPPQEVQAKSWNGTPLFHYETDEKGAFKLDEHKQPIQKPTMVTERSTMIGRGAALGALGGLALGLTGFALTRNS